MRNVRVLAALAAASAFGACGGNAFAASQIITLNATVPGYCTVGGSSTSVTTTATVPILATGFPNTAAIPVAGLGAVICNENAQLTLNTLNGGLTGPSATTGFSIRIDYTAVATYGTVPGSGTSQTITTTGAANTTTAASTSSTVGASASTPFTVTVTPITTANPLAIGAYTDTLTVNFLPHV